MSDDTEREATITEDVESTDRSDESAGETDHSDESAGETESTAGETESTAGETGGGETAVDSAADSFLSLEQELDVVPDGMQVRGQAIDVERIPASEVPDDFPAEIATEDALALTLELVDQEGKTVVTYFEWPTDGTGHRLSKLLELRDVPLDRFADLHGEQILLTAEDGHFVPVLPDEEPRGDDRAVYGILAGLLPSLLVFVAGMLGATGGPLFTSTFILLWLFATLIVLPVSTYFDAWDLRTTTDWEGGPLFWAFFAMIPGLNILTCAAYLIIRQNAEPII